MRSAQKSTPSNRSDSNAANEVGRRRKAERAGRFAEVLAAAYLALKGYRPIALRARTARGELDLIVRRGTLIVFVEVRRRRSVNEAAYSVTPAKQARIIAASQAWLSGRPDLSDHNCRFDCILMGSSWRPVHLVDAFSTNDPI